MEDKTKPTVEQAAPEARFPYQAPTLRKLGSIRELTLGGTKGGRKDGIIGKKV